MCAPAKDSMSSSCSDLGASSRGGTDREGKKEPIQPREQMRSLAATPSMKCQSKEGLPKRGDIVQSNSSEGELSGYIEGSEAVVGVVK